MEIRKMNPRNWFKKAQDQEDTQGNMPVKRGSYNPFSDNYPLLQIHHEIDQLFDRMFSEFYRATPFPDFIDNLSRPNWYGIGRPRVDVVSDDTHYTITVEMPGIDADAIDLVMEK